MSAVSQQEVLTTEITLADRCDSCSAPAKVIVTFVTGSLMFCGHHSRELSKSLIEKSISIYDPEEFI